MLRWPALQIKVLLIALFSFTLGLIFGAMSLKDSLRRLIEPPTQLMILSYQAVLPAELLRSFEQKHNVQIHLKVTSSTPEFFAYVQMPRSPYDILIPRSYQVEPLISQHLLGLLNLDLIDNRQNIAADFQSATINNRYTLPIQWGVNGLLGEIEVLDRLTSWRQIYLDPNLRKKVWLLPESEEILATIMRQKSIFDPEKLATPLETLQRNLGELLSKVSLDMTLEAKPNDDNIKVVQISNGKASRFLKAESRYKFMIPEEGVSFWTQNIARSNKSTNAKLAQEFINFVLRKDSSLLLVAFNQEATTNRHLESLALPALQKPSYLRQIPLNKMETLIYRGKFTQTWDHLVRTIATAASGR